MRVKRPAEICAGDRIWLWSTHAWIAVTHVDQRPYDTAMLSLADGQIIEAYTTKMIR